MDTNLVRAIAGYLVAKELFDNAEQAYRDERANLERSCNSEFMLILEEDLESARESKRLALLRLVEFIKP